MPASARSTPARPSREVSTKPATMATAMAMPKRRAGRSGSSQGGGRRASHRPPASSTARATAVPGGSVGAMVGG